jgi:predicted TIM-barrel fold metal-dependent hydrolase
MIIDLDSHLREEYFLDEVYRLPEPYQDYTPKRIGDGRYQHARFEHKLYPWGQEVGRHFDHALVYDPDANWRGGEVARRQQGGWDMEFRLRDADREGIDLQMLFPTRIQLPTTYPGPMGAVLCQQYNNWVRELIRGHEDRLLPVALMPAGHPEAMADELKRAVGELGFRAAHLVPYVGERNLDDPVFDPFYATAQELGVPLFCHPNSEGHLINRFDNFFAMHVLGRPLNCTAALVALVTGGVFERFPDLKVVFFECSAEWILYWMHRMDDDYKNMQYGFAPKIAAAPSEYIRRNCYVTCEADERHLGWAVEEIGADHILMATDYPHFDSEFPETVSGIRGRSDIDEETKRKILGENARRLLRL